jgi:hypothetical protein
MRSPLLRLSQWIRRLGSLPQVGPPLLAGALALALYAYTAAPSLTWAHHGQDGGDLIAAAMTWGVPHPSGYPTYCLLGRLFALLPLGDAARRFNLFSALAAACAVGLTCDTTARILGRTGRISPWLQSALSLGAALCLAASPALWSQAIIAEVYALNALFCSLCLNLALRLDGSSPAFSWFWLGLSLGLGLGNHLTLLWLTPALALWLRPWAARRRGMAALLGLGAGLAVYGYIPLAAGGDPPVNWGEPRTWQGLWWLVTGRYYHGYLWRWRWVQRIPLAPALYPAPTRLLSWIGLWVRQFTPVGLALAVVGFGAWLQGRGHTRRLALALLLGIGLWSAYALGYDTVDSYLYLLPAFLVATPALAAGALCIAQAASLRARPLLRVLAPGLLCALAIGSALQHGPLLALRHDDEATRWLEATLADLPAQSVVLTGEDGHTFALSYALWVEHRRPDLALIDGELWAQPWYAEQVRRRHPDLDATAALSLAELVETTLDQRAVCLTSPRPDIAARYAVRVVGDLACLERLPAQ